MNRCYPYAHTVWLNVFTCRSTTWQLFQILLTENIFQTHIMSVHHTVHAVTWAHMCVCVCVKFQSVKDLIKRDVYCISKLRQVPVWPCSRLVTGVYKNTADPLTCASCQERYTTEYLDRLQCKSIASDLMNFIFQAPSAVSNLVP